MTRRTDQILTKEALIMDPEVERLKNDFRFMQENLRKLGDHLRLLQPALNVMAKEVLDDVIHEHVDTVLACSALSQTQSQAQEQSK